MLRLFTENPETSEAVFPIRWCMTRDILAKLERKTVEPLLLISVMHEHAGNVLRLLVPLKQEMEWIELNRKGVHTIHARIVWRKHYSSKLKKLRAKIDRQFEPGSYSHTLHDDSGEINSHCLFETFELCGGEATSIDINVGEEFFAKEPPEWEKRWVNALFPSDARNQCDFRRRRILAYTLQPFFFILVFLFLGLVRTLFAAISLLLGMRVSFSPIWHPIEQSTMDVCPKVGQWHEPEDYRRGYSIKYFSPQNSFFLTTSAGEMRSLKFFFMQPLAVLAVTGLFVGLIKVLSLKVLLTLIGMALGVFLIVKASVFGARFFQKTATKSQFAVLLKKLQAWKNARQAKKEKLAKLEEQKRAEEWKTRYNVLVCDAPIPLRASVYALPKERQTVSLRFKAFKADVCRPFSK